jgi:hypothetical protein
MRRPLMPPQPMPWGRKPHAHHPGVELARADDPQAQPLPIDSRSVVFS